MGWKRGLWILLALAVLPAAPGTGVAAGGEAGDLLEKVVGAYGGERALSQVVVLRETGRVGSKMRGVEGELLRVYRSPGDLRVEISYPGTEREVRVLSGKNG